MYMLNLSRAVEWVDSMDDCSTDSYQTCISQFLIQWAIYQKYDQHGHESPSGF